MTVAPYVPEPLPPAGIDWEAHIPQIASANRALADTTASPGYPEPEILLIPTSPVSPTTLPSATISGYFTPFHHRTDWRRAAGSRRFKRIAQHRRVRRNVFDILKERGVS